MKILYYDCFSGISGDMNLGALIDLGVDKDYLISELKKLKIEEEYEIKVKKALKMGITGTKVDVILKNEKKHHHHEEKKDDHKHSHEHKTEHKHHSHDHEHRNLKIIKDIIFTSELSEKVKDMSLNIFMKVAEAEAKVHGKSIDEVHFHEVGATDSIIDIVGAAICLDYLNVEKVISSTIELGGGFVNCAHGIIPVPAPATMEILKNRPIKTGKVEFETTTPTGAAILAATVNEFTDKNDFTIRKIGYGLGTRDMEIPNVLRVYLGEVVEEEIKTKEVLFETNIDDMNPEYYEFIEKKLFDNGAVDVFRTSIIMKKGRMATKLSVLSSLENEQEILSVIFKETSSIGLRRIEVDKIMLERKFTKVKTKYGDVNIKNAYYLGEKVCSKPEYEDCRKLAERNNISIKEIYKEVIKVSND